MNKDMIIQEACKARFEPVVNKIEQLLSGKDERILVAIDGNAAAGKTTLGYYLKSIFSCNLYHMDDFFLRDEQRTAERLEEIGGNVDYERFRSEVIEPILGKEDIIYYRPFSCKERKIKETIKISCQRLHIVEGSYSQHPYFGDIYQQRIFMEISKEKQIDRIRRRNGEAMLERFLAEWIPKEDKYFEKFEIRRQSMIIKDKKQGDEYI